MAKQAKTAISPRRDEDYPEWYQQVVKAAGLAEASPVRGCMVIKPWGFAIWENMQRVLDRRFKETGHENAYFPLFIPKSYLEKEAEHVEGFAKECAVVTHHRLEAGPEGGLVPAGELTEPLVVRPTSETIIGEVYAKWVQSYRDLPILINQWANVVRWEMRTRLFLRTTEFLWQEGHTCHATAEEAVQETLQMLDVYAEFAEQTMALPVIKGEKSADERFPGAVNTYSIEAMMQDRKALQAGTSHFLGQNFSRAAGIKFLDQGGTEQLVWTTSWGVSTRLVGALIMGHSDDDGLVIPPRLAPRHVVIIPFVRGKDQEADDKVLAACRTLKQQLEATPYFDDRIRVQLDDRDMRGGEKTWEHVKKGVPIRIEIGPKDLDNDAVTLYRRDEGPKERHSVPLDSAAATVAGLLDELQTSLYTRAKQHLTDNTRVIDSTDELFAWFTPKNKDKPEIHGGFALCHWAEDPATVKLLKEHKLTIRNIPLPGQLEGSHEPGKCIFTGKDAQQRVVISKAY